MAKPQSGRRLARIDSVNKQVICLFRQHMPPNGLMPMLYDGLAYRPVILFMGINPSFPKKFISSYIQNHPAERRFLPSGLKEFYFKYSGRGRNAKLEYFQRVAKAEYFYFKPFHRVGDKLGLKMWDPKPGKQRHGPFWEHIDLLFSRGVPSQRKVFIAQQVDRTRELIEIIEPKNIVVANSKACDIMREHKLIANYDEKEGWGRMAFGSHAPVFLAGHWANEGHEHYYTSDTMAAYLRCHMHSK